jgi:riboflavin kinase/FMN adenylyltransferase
MKREIGLEAITPNEHAVVTVGTFDGVHRGHQAILRYLTERARQQHGVSTVVSFDPHPRNVVHGESVPLLSTIRERAALLEQHGLERFVVIPFTKAFAQLSPQAYVDEILLQRVGLKEIVIGYDHRFGKNREGDRELLERMGSAHGFSVDVIPPQEVDHDVVSSSKIRTLLADEGDVHRAAEMLGRPYALHGTVQQGEKRGRKLGYPTANIGISDPDKLIPRIGVYATRVQVGDTAPTYGGMMNIGRRPTFDEMDVTVEVHLLGFEGAIYGEMLHVEFLQRLRDEQKFDSVDALVAQLSRDEKHCRSVLNATEAA